MWSTSSSLQDNIKLIGILSSSWRLFITSDNASAINLFSVNPLDPLIASITHNVFKFFLFAVSTPQLIKFI